MKTTIALARHSVVLILGNRRQGEPMARLADRMSAVSAPWDVQKPDEGLARLHDALKGDGPVRVCMFNSNGKARRQVASAAKKRGAIPIAIRLPGAETMAADEGYAQIIDLAADTDPEFVIVPMPSDLRRITGAFDLVGDVHGCFIEMMDLLTRLGYVDELTGLPQRHPQGRRLVMLGDLTDRGPMNLAVLRMVRLLEQYGAIRILGNHDEKLAKWLKGRDVRIAAGLMETIAELELLDDEERRDMGEWLGSAQPHVMLDGGALVAAHAGISADLQGRHTSGARSMALYGKVTGGLDENGHPEAEDWALDYDGDAVVVHGHVVHPEPRIVGNVVAVDNGCVFGGKLTAYQWPERTFVSVAARETYWCPADDVIETEAA